MNDKKIYIPQEAISLTKLACAREQQMVREKQNTTWMELFLRFQRIDLRGYFKVSFVGFVFMMIIHLSFPQLQAIPITLYFFLLGGMAIYELYKNNYYRTTELFYPVYLNQGRVMLYKNATIAVLELCFFFLFLILSMCLSETSATQLFLSSLCPLFLAQICLLNLTNFIHTMNCALICYVGIFGIYTSVYVTFRSILLEHMNFVSTVILFAILMFGFILTILHFIKGKQKEGTHYGIDFGTY